MQIKLKFALPAIQIVLAAFLLHLGTAQHSADKGKEINYGPPAKRICYAINAPALLFRFGGLYVWDAAHLPSAKAYAAIDNGIFIVGVGLLWFLVGAGIESGLKRSEKAKAALSRSLRLVIDSGLIVLGVAFVLFGLGAWNLIHWGSVLQASTEASIYFVWALSLLVIFVRDFILCFSARR